VWCDEHYDYQYLNVNNDEYLKVEY